MRCREWSTASSGKDVRLQSRLEKVAPVLADRGQIDQVLMNLIINARDALPNGGYITIETQDIELGEEYAATHLGVKQGDYVPSWLCSRRRTQVKPFCCASNFPTPSTFSSPISSCRS